MKKRKNMKSGKPKEVENWEKIRFCAFIEFIYNGIMGILSFLIFCEL
jgi:hypothetical protein